MRISDWSSDVCSSDLKGPRVDVGRSRSSRAKSRDGSKHVSTSLDTNGYGIIMCGIIGILGKDEVTERMVEGLMRLEYRGYRTEERRVGQEGVCTSRYRWSPNN